MWEEYFPNAKIYALDIESEILINRGRIRSFQCDQSKESDLLNASLAVGVEFDLIIDDGSHVAEHPIQTARTFVPLLAPGGIYIVEDIHLRNAELVQHSIPFTSELVEIRDRDGNVGDLLLRVWGN